MKIGILSLTWGYNFGGTLQTWSLYRSLTDLGHAPVVIDYRPVPESRERIFDSWGMLNADRWSRVSRRLAALAYGGAFRRKYRRFKARELSWTRPCRDLPAVLKAVQELDAVVVGSDQVWNLAYHCDPVFQLAGCDDFRGRRIAYAACCGDPTQPAPPWGASALQRFDAVGVRNEFTATWVRRCTAGSVAPAVVCDPTVLVDDFPRQSMRLPSSYIAAYHIGEASPEEEQRIVARLRERFGNIPIVALMATGTAIRMISCHDERLWLLDPFEWVEVLRRATAIWTDSFHAVLFSLRYRVPFVATYAEALRAPRLIDLRDRFGLHGRVIGTAEAPELAIEPNWAGIHAILCEDREQSWAFLRNALS
jgi:hypothetical protein